MFLEITFGDEEENKGNSQFLAQVMDIKRLYYSGEETKLNCEGDEEGAPPYVAIEYHDGNRLKMTEDGTPTPMKVWELRYQPRVHTVEMRMIAPTAQALYEAVRGLIVGRTPEEVGFTTFGIGGER